MTSPELARKLRKHHSTESYLQELEQLVGRPVDRSELSDFSHVDSVIQRWRGLSSLPRRSFELGFEEKKTPHFTNFVERLVAANGSPVYIWTQRAFDCGILGPFPLSEIDFGFDYSLNGDGLVSFLTTDFEDRLVLNFFEAAGAKKLEVEVQGRSWSNVEF